MSAQPPNPPFQGHLGAVFVAGGVQFAVYAAPGGRARLLLFDSPDATKPARTLELDPVTNRTADYWHITVPGVGHGQVYNWQIEADDGPAVGWGKTLLDPYGLAVTGTTNYDRQAAKGDRDNSASALRSLVVDLERYDWQGDATPPRPNGREFIYELHLAAFTADSSSGLAADLRGTYRGLAAKVDHLVALGVTAVELMPVQAFDWQDAPADKVNYWGYSPVSYFAPHPGYSRSADPVIVLDEFRDMVRTLHAAGLRVIMDVVYNHTAEAGPEGPRLCWRGFAEQTYYLIDPHSGRYRDYTGCGNTFNANHPVVQRLITDSLRHWVTAYHIDGFRFDLAAAHTRDQDGEPMARPPVIWAIDTDPGLAACRLIAEAWDTGGQHLVGNFPGRRFATWNGPYRDAARRFLRGDEGMIEEVMARIVGSPDLYNHPASCPADSINFVTCHDGFTLCDLVSYEQKQNEENGEDNRDGSNDNLSWNSGIEGPTDESAVVALRERRQRNFITLLFFSLGTPMLWSGDEWGQSRRGNNNPWCLDNERNRLDWRLARTNDGLLRFVTLTARLANSLPALSGDRYWTATSPAGKGDISWHGLQPGRPDWSAGSRHLAYELHARGDEGSILVLLNAESQTCLFATPPLPPGCVWQPIIDTGAPSPADFQESAPLPQGKTQPVPVAEHTIKVLRSIR